MLTRTRTAAVTIGVALALPAAAQATTVGGAGAQCFAAPEQAHYQPRDWATVTPAMAPTLTISDIPRNTRSRFYSYEVVNAPGRPETLFSGNTRLEDEDQDGVAVAKHLAWTPRSLLTNGEHIATPRTETSRLEVYEIVNNDLGTKQLTGTVDFTLGLLAADVPMRDRANQRRKSRWRVSGLGPGTYYAHFRRGGKTDWRLRLGRATGPCGYLSTKNYSVPPKNKKGKRWDIVITNGPTFRPNGAHLIYRGRNRAHFSPGKFFGMVARP
jgi:hypothetical protein